MALGWKKTPDETHPAVKRATKTTYQPSRGGYFPAPKKPVPGTPKK
ncbi:hypothetical protein [Streptomyces griseoviridis]|uniref:Multidrug transporter n=1 Tax=Streptomyces griseoviridis TaxID=45398 RepID=A0ABT9LF77_STRGD|nr:hypothetical protein [Streptomyces griseoviridis]MDP9682379.1 hypothetical protein [Streptomyces griseoviridis]GGS81884.1 hypothetical protein GCM10010240_14070 [Streptomyces griseoviridis]